MLSEIIISVHIYSFNLYITLDFLLFFIYFTLEAYLATISFTLDETSLVNYFPITFLYTQKPIIKTINAPNNIPKIMKIKDSPDDFYYDYDDEHPYVRLEQMASFMLLP